MQEELLERKVERTVPTIAVMTFTPKGASSRRRVSLRQVVAALEAA